MDITIKDLILATNGSLVQGNVNYVVKNICTDTRKIQKNDLFIPIVGEKFDGHTYINDAILGGASVILTQKPLVIDNKDVVVVQVKDTKRAYLDIAKWYRKRFNIPFIGVVGSVGKTSTKDMIACVLETNMNVLKTEGNFNNEIGVPITIFRIDDTKDVAILEMGMSNKGEISRLTDVVLPQYVVISNIGVSHIENLGSRENILAAKLEVLEGLSKDGVVFINNDDDMLSKVVDKIGFRVVTYGIESKCDYTATNVRTDEQNRVLFDIEIDGKVHKVSIPSVGKHNVYNALAAISVGRQMNISVPDIIKGIGNFKAGKMRLNIEDNGRLKIINDTYNASPDSMKAAIDVLCDISKGRRSVAVLGDMLELGSYLKVEHTKIGEYIGTKNVDCVVTVGNASKYIAKALENMGHNEVYSFSSNKEATEFLNNFLKDGDVVLFKASRGMKLEELIDSILKRWINA